VKYLSQPNAGPASARNCGVRHASGEILLFTDSDCRPEHGWIEKLVQGFSTEDVAVIAGSYGITNPESLLARIIHEEIRYRHEFLMPEFPKAFGSYNFAVRRSVFEEVGGFNTDYRRASGEDNDLSYKILKTGRRIRFLRDVVVDHYHQVDLGKYLKEQFRHGIWRVRMYIDHPDMAAGDDYTFWKDILEVPAVLAGLAAVFFPGPVYAMVLIFVFFVFEIFFGIRMMRRIGAGAAAGIVFWLRAYARSAGFFIGAAKFIIYLIKREKTPKFPCGTKVVC
jgi:GT2 family glycosyltransferase